MTRYLLDTNTVSYLIRSHPRVAARVVAVPMASLCISAITEGELLFGLAKRPEATRLYRAVQEFLSRITVLPWASQTAQSYGPLRAELQKAGTTVAPIDLLIAAHALEVGAVLVTSDQALFQVPQLKLENWAA
jgi:tRNA(fMet)-specific endonuclease VapC